MIWLLLSCAHQPPGQAAREQQLAELVEVWGFLAFHHPAIASGAVDWDQALFEALPLPHDRALRTLVSRLPAPPPGEALTPAPAWVADLPDDVGEAVLAAHSASRTGAHVWVDLVAGRPRFTPPTIDDAPMPPPAVRVLAVARLWTLVRWTYPYLDGVEQAWHDALPVALDEVLDAPSALSWHRAVQRMANHLDDGHVVVQSAVLHDSGPEAPRMPVSLWPDAYGEGPLVLQVWAEGNGLSPGERLVALDGVPWNEATARSAAYVSGSTPMGRAFLRDRDHLTWHAGDTPVTIEAVDGTRREQSVALGAPMLFTRPVPLHETPFRVLDDGTVIAELQNLTDDDLGPLFTAAADAPGLLLDLRAYPAMLLPTLVNCLTDTDRVAARYRKVRLDQPGTFQLEDALPVGGGSCPGPDYTGPVAVVVDFVTFSRGEFVAQALMSVPRVQLIGVPTAGTDGNLTGTRLPGGLAVDWTGMGVTLPDGTPVQRVGLQPHIRVEPTPAELQTGRDLLLDAALSALR